MFERVPRLVSRVCVEGRLSRVACFQTFSFLIGSIQTLFLGGSALFGAEEDISTLSATTKIIPGYNT